jgi:dUTP pyrophosphatase
MSTSPIAVSLKLVHPNAVVPKYATEGSACFDLHSTEDGVVPARSSAKFGTGLAVEIPVGRQIKIHSRSGHGFKNGIRLANCQGVIDSDYRGEMFVKLTNDTDDDFPVKAGDRIAQGELQPVLKAEFVLADTLSETSRGAGGFGSTGT